MAAKKKDDISSEDLMAKLVGGMNHVNEGKSSFVYGEEANEFFEPRYFFPTGIRLLDTIIGEGGLGSGRISELFGPERSGKSEIAQQACRAFLTSFPTGLCFYFDQEMALDKKKMDAVPVFRSRRFAVAVKPTIQDLFADIEKMLLAIKKLKAKTPVLIALDSIAMTETAGEAKKTLKDITVAEMGRFLSPAMRRIKPIIQETNAHLLVLNQIRSKIGDTFVPEESPGGKALKFAADYRIKTMQLGAFYLRSTDKANKAHPPDGFMIRVETVKNKRVPPNRVIELPLLYSPTKGGISNAWAVFNMFRKMEIMGPPSGKFFSLRYGPDREGDLLKFHKAEWPIVYQEQAEKIDIPYRNWAAKFMMETVEDGVPADEDGEDEE